MDFLMDFDNNKRLKYIFLTHLYFCLLKIYKTNVSTWVQITFWICVLAVWINKGYFAIKKLVWNVRIKDFWYTNFFITYIVYIFVSISMIFNPFNWIDWSIVESGGKSIWGRNHAHVFISICMDFKCKNHKSKLI